ncbi:ISPsy13, transposase OrfB [Pseudomonas coronafaciens pv. oryzae]|nr:ISPsy13, transposase OrfB [Pseudomonas coronafaciens pv. oryzae]
MRHLGNLYIFSFLRARRRELRNPNVEKAGRIPLAGLVLVHSRHIRDFRTRSRRPQVPKAAFYRKRSGRYI